LVEKADSPMRILVVDDDLTSVEILEHFLGKLGYEVSVAYNGHEANEMIRDCDFRVVISDWEMPEMNGIELCRSIRKRNLGSYVYFVLLTNRGGTHDLIEALEAGVDDYICKPFQPDELRVRLHAADRIASLESRDLLIFAMAKLTESRDPETGAHLERMRRYARVLAEQLRKDGTCRGEIDHDFIRTLFLTCPLHDIGKVGIPDQVLLKPGRLTKEEFEIMKQHTVIGSQTLDAALVVHPSADFLRFARDIAWTHHEKYDGSGYPRHLMGEEIPLCGRIVAIADVYDALTTKRVYKPAYSHDVAREIIMEGSGSAFDPDMVSAFLDCEEKFVEIHRQLTPQQDPDISICEQSILALA
jgi:putative two-component system response regulator